MYTSTFSHLFTYLVQPSLSANSNITYEQQIRQFDTIPAGLMHQTRYSILKLFMIYLLIHSFNHSIRMLSVTYPNRPAPGDFKSLSNNLLHARHATEIEFISVEWSPCGIYPGTYFLIHSYLLTYSSL